MKAVLTITLDLPDYELMLRRAKVWMLANNYRYSDDEPKALLTDYLLDEAEGYSIREIDLDK